MKIQKIDIQTSNKKHATDITMLIDKPEFVQDLQKLREKWKIDKLYEPGNFYGFFATNVELKGRVSEFNNDINGLLKKFHRGRNFKQVVENAMVTGVIPDGIYQSCYFDVVTIGEPEDLNKPERYQYVIVMSPRTEQREVEQAYKDFEKHIKGYEPKNEFETGELGKIEFHTRDLNIEIPTDKELIEQYHKGNIYKSAIIDDGNRRDLERARDWHWIRFRDYLNGIDKKPETYEDITYEWNCKCPQYPTEDKEHNKTCEYCHVDASNVAHTLSPYNKLLEIDGMKF